MSAAIRRLKWRDFSKQLRKRRRSLDFGLRELARAIEVTRSTLCRAEQGKVIEAADFIYLCNLMGADPRQFLYPCKPSPRKQGEAVSRAPVEIRPNDDGSIDEIVAHGCNLHIEQMSDSNWYMGIEASDGSYWQFWFGAKNQKSHVVFHHTETTLAEDIKPLSSPESRGKP